MGRFHDNYTNITVLVKVLLLNSKKFNCRAYLMNNRFYQSINRFY